MSLADTINDVFARYGLSRDDAAPAVAVIRLQGIIGAVGLGRRGLTVPVLEPLIKRAFSARVRAVCLIINSPGGSAVQSAHIAARIRQYSQDKKIPVFAFAEDVIASGGYWLGLAEIQRPFGHAEASRSSHNASSRLSAGSPALTVGHGLPARRMTPTW